MTKAIRLRRVLIATLIVTAIMTVFPASQSMAATGGLSKIPAKVCDINWRRDTRHVKGLIRCAARHFGGRDGGRVGPRLRSRHALRRHNRLCIAMDGRDRCRGFRRGMRFHRSNHHATRRRARA